MKRKLALFLSALALMFGIFACAAPMATTEPPISSSINAKVSSTQLTSSDQNVHANTAMDLTITSTDKDFPHICTLKQAGKIIQVHRKDSAKDSLINTIQLAPGATVVSEIAKLAPGAYTLECDMAGHKTKTISLNAK